MADVDGDAPRSIDRIRHWLCLDRTQRTDNSEANRGFYPGGPPVYLDRKPVGRRFVVPVWTGSFVMTANRRPTAGSPLRTMRTDS